MGVYGVVAVAACLVMHVILCESVIEMFVIKGTPSSRGHVARRTDKSARTDQGTRTTRMSILNGTREDYALRLVHRMRHVVRTNAHNKLLLKYQMKIITDAGSALEHTQTRTCDTRPRTRMFAVRGRTGAITCHRRSSAIIFNHLLVLTCVICAVLSHNVDNMAIVGRWIQIMRLHTKHTHTDDTLDEDVKENIYSHL